MSFLDNVICPISNIKINSYTSRLTVFINVVLMGLYLLTGIRYFMIIVAIDYGIRAFWKPQYSPLRWLAEQIARATNLPEKWVDQAPKLFASRIGFGFSATSVLLMPLGGDSAKYDTCEHFNCLCLFRLCPRFLCRLPNLYLHCIAFLSMARRTLN